MYEQSLLQVGLTKDQATVYETLVKNGPSPASRIARKTPLSRPLVYKILGELMAMELVDKKEEEGKISIFAPAHPLKLKDFVEKKIEHANNAKTALEGAIGKLSSDFNSDKNGNKKTPSRFISFETATKSADLKR